ncbi:HAD-IB family hydrolase [Candidatus Uhrbacteria bacterium CG10_big_fil_rev_8_21_14_0_10_48_11]|uniref:phosphoserine phosphatase n=1 Tax=Candidatus Uhrbacteria bacterium CG10_big_fil_rev_8_21_14_0_10_48_11 TaxID=1975037 RepID=A0A2M8LDV2_9BACT|nr:MAG: HAD-IB family hydrolase [Candidatus Uhrbacteria bacterium CG10_big_fil_rev_8_21_14_0_10_48_11]
MGTPKKKKIAIFDIDGTLFRSSLLVEFNKGLMRAGIIPQSVIGDILQEYYAWVERRGSYDDYIGRVVTMHSAAMKGKLRRDVDAAAHLVLLRHRNRVYRYTRDLLRTLSPDYMLLAISGSPAEMVAPFGEYFSFDRTWGTEYEIDDRGVYTGRIVDRRSVDSKAEIVSAFIKEQGLDLAESWGVGDTETDISFLEMVDHPVAFNPTAALFAVAKEKSWHVVVERKNVIYDIPTEADTH